MLSDRPEPRIVPTITSTSPGISTYVRASARMTRYAANVRFISAERPHFKGSLETIRKPASLLRRLV